MASGQIGRAVAILEAIAAGGSSSARDVADRTGIPLPSVYRIAGELIREDYLVHLRDESRFALGWKLHRLAVSLHEDLGIPAAARREVRALQEDIAMASYLAIHRGTDFVVVHVADAPQCPRLQPMEFGFHEHPHATAFGKLGLSELSPSELAEHLHQHPLRALTPATITDPDRLADELADIARRGVAWEHGEFSEGVHCLAVPIRAGDGTLLGSVAVSAPARRFAGQERHVEDRVRACASRAGRAYRLGGHQH